MMILYQVMGFVMMLLPYLIAALLGLALPAFGVLAYSRFGLGVGLVAFCFGLDAVSLGSASLNLGISVSFTDLALVFLAIIAGLRYLQSDEYPRRDRAWLVFMLVFAGSLALGLVSNGSSAGVSARGYFYGIVATLYAMSFRVDEARVAQFFNVMVALAGVLFVLCIYRWVVYYTPITDLLPDGGTYNVDGAIRVIGSESALVVAEVLVLCLFFGSSSGGMKFLRILSPFLLAMVVALQHRSIWLATLVGIATALFVARSRSASRVMQVFFLVVVVSLAALPLVFSSSLSGVAEQAATSATNALEGQGTVSERSESWKEIVDKWAHDGPKVILIGHSFGTDNSRIVHDSEHGLRRISYAAHNYYVQTLDNLGLIGLLSFLAVTAYSIAGLYSMCLAEEGGVYAPSLLVLLIMQLAYYVPYNGDYAQHLILGVAFAYVASHRLVPGQAGLSLAAQA